ncbi:MAG: hypothetical protein ABWK15_01790 [Dissulfuribacterales bacterium]
MEKTFTHSDMQQALARMVSLQDDILAKMRTDAAWITELPVWTDQYTQAAQQLRNLLEAYQHDEHRQEYAQRVQFLIEQQENILTMLQKQRDELAIHMRQLEQGKKAIQSYSSCKPCEKQVFLSMDT